MTGPWPLSPSLPSAHIAHLKCQSEKGQYFGVVLPPGPGTCMNPDRDMIFQIYKRDSAAPRETLVSRVCHPNQCPTRVWKGVRGWTISHQCQGDSDHLDMTLKVGGQRAAGKHTTCLLSSLTNYMDFTLKKLIDLKKKYFCSFLKLLVTVSMSILNRTQNLSQPRVR